MAKKRRRRKKSGGKGGGIAVMTLQPGQVPTDEQLEEEAKQLEKELDSKTQKRFDDAKKDGYDLASLQVLVSCSILRCYRITIAGRDKYQGQEFRV